MPGRGQIAPYHNDVVAEINRILGETVTFFPPNSERWDMARYGSQVTFELVYQDTVISEHAMRMRREDSVSHRVSVFPLRTRYSPYAGTFWVSWHEAWQKKESTDFVLLSTGWTLFEGLAGNQDKIQVLRLDWDQRPHAGSYNAGHPHWHFDHELFISAEPDNIEVAPGLVQIATDTGTGMSRQASIGFVHLAMGAWNSDMDHPDCWQRTYEDDCRNLRDWCVKTLIYLKEQVGGVVNA